MSSYLTALQLNLLGCGLLVGTQRVCRKLGLPSPPLKLPLLAAVLMPWLTLIETGPGLVMNSALQPYLRTLNLLIGSYATIRLMGWLVLELPPRMHWWRASPKILGDLMMLGISIIVTLVLIHHQLRINLIGIAATSAALTAVVGLAAQSTLKDIFAGIALQLDTPFQEGDWIDLEFTKGIVLSLRLMSTRLRTIDSAEVVVPNSRITSEGLRRFRPQEPVGHSFEVALDASLPARQGIQLLENTLKNHPRILSQPSPQVWISRYSEMGLVYRTQYWQKEIGDLGERQLRSELLEQIWYSLSRSGHSLPYPGLEVRRKSRLNGQADPRATLDERIKVLRKCTLLRSLTQDELTELAGCTRQHIYGPGEVVIRQGDKGDSFFVVAEGALSVWRSERNETNVPIKTIKEGEVFGEMAVFTGNPRSASVVSLRESRLLAIERQDLLSMIKSSPETLEKLSELIARRQDELRMQRELHQSDDEIKNLTTRIRLFFQSLLLNHQ